MASQFGGAIASADVDQSHAKAIYGAVVTITILATIFVVLRFVARSKSKAPYSYGT